jgi:ABC-type uncharacterized transport system substrate-binding protein
MVLFLLMLPQPADAGKRPRIMVVMSYAEQKQWCQDIRSGIEAGLSGDCDLTYAFLNAVSQPEQIAQRAAAAYDLYKRLRPQGVIAADDHAQAHFVVPYLRDKTDTPVIFCGVNAKPEAYGYPAHNVTGVLERYHIKASLALLQQLVPSVRQIAFIGVDAPTGNLMLQQARKQMPALAVTHARYVTVKTQAELVASLTTLRSEVDAVYISVLRGLVGPQGRLLSERECMHLVTENFPKPVVCASLYDMRHGALCSVVHTGEEQGHLAAELTTKVIAGVPVAQLPVMRNYNGRRIINVSTLKELGIKPRPILMRGAELIRNAPRPIPQDETRAGHRRMLQGLPETKSAGQL